MPANEASDCRPSKVLYSVEGAVATISLNRPEKLNAINEEMYQDIMSALDKAGADERVSVVILKGEGRAFSVGHDINPANHAKHRTISADRERVERNLARCLRIWDFPKPVVAQVHGFCIAGATLIVLCCDLTIIAEDTRVRWPTIPLGGGMIGAASTMVIGPKKAKEMSFIAGSEMSGTEAVALGWANHAVPADELEHRTQTMCRLIAKTPPDLLRLKKAAINRVMDLQGFRTAFMYGAEWDAICHFTEGMTEIRERIKKHGFKETINWFAETDPSWS